MPVLKNVRHEKFAQNVAKGMTATEAYVKAGYKPSEAHVSRLAGYGKVRTRVAELMAPAVEATQAIVAWHVLSFEGSEPPFETKEMNASTLDVEVQFNGGHLPATLGVTLGSIYRGKVRVSDDLAVTLLLLCPILTERFSEYGPKLSAL